MLTNRREYVSTKKKIKQLQNALEISKQSKLEMPDVIFKAMVAGVQSQIDDMQEELRQYEEFAAR